MQQEEIKNLEEALAILHKKDSEISSLKAINKNLDTALTLADNYLEDLKAFSGCGQNISLITQISSLKDKADMWDRANRSGSVKSGYCPA